MQHRLSSLAVASTALLALLLVSCENSQVVAHAEKAQLRLSRQHENVATNGQPSSYPPGCSCEKNQGSLMCLCPGSGSQVTPVVLEDFQACKPNSTVYANGTLSCTRMYGCAQGATCPNGPYLKTCYCNIGGINEYEASPSNDDDLYCLCQTSDGSLDSTLWYSVCKDSLYNSNGKLICSTGKPGCQGSSCTPGPYLSQASCSQSGQTIVCNTNGPNSTLIPSTLTFTSLCASNSIVIQNNALSCNYTFGCEAGSSCPTGPYLNSCNCYTGGDSEYADEHHANTLSCRCLNDDGYLLKTTWDLPCADQIYNIDGYLACLPKNGTGCIDNTCPTGPYLNSSYCGTNGPVLDCYIFGQNGTISTSSIADYLMCAPNSIAVANGALTCTFQYGCSSGTCPAGPYLSSCNCTEDDGVLSCFCENDEGEVQSTSSGTCTGTLYNFDGSLFCFSS